METGTKQKVVIVGGGIAGLTAGIYAQLAGFEAHIYEKNALPGGECMSWNRKGYQIDNCIHWLTGTKKDTALYNVWKNVGAIDDDTEYADTQRFYASRYNGHELSLWKDLERTRKELTEFSPEDEEEIKRFIQYVRYARGCVVPSKKPLDMMGIKDYIELGKEMGDMSKVMKDFGKVDCKTFAQRFKDPAIRKLMTDYLPPEYTVYSFMVSYASISCGNGNIPLGGSLGMSLRIAKRFKDLGGEFHGNSAVSKIMIEGKRCTGIELEDGTVVKADHVISAVDMSFLFGKLIDGRYMPKDYRTAYENSKAYPITSGFQVAYAVDDTFDVEDTVFFDCEDIKIGEKSIGRMSMKNYRYDKSFAPGGKAVIQVNLVQTDDDFEYWASLSDEEYKQKKAEIASEITKRLTTEFAELEGNIELLDCWTPLTYNRYCNAYHGAYMGFMTTASNKQLKMKGVVKGVDDLYIAGQWTMNPGGLPIALVSGKFAVQRILKKQKRSIDI
ncbi:MAG: NAD(P)/FAD-dependent oxidoreductase [Saccharofermentans sp.]|nr:NAD(P)/FAD-dependent oxidoreductase [Saccharofermentans sp.]